MRLRDVVRAAAHPPVQLPPVPATASAVHELERLFAGMIDAPPRADLDEVDARFRRAVAAGEASILASGDWRHSPFLLWYRAPVLADDPTFMRWMGERIGSSATRIDARRLLSVYLREFDIDNPGIREVASWLERLCQSWDWPWRERAALLSLFDLAVAPSRVGRACLEHPAGGHAFLAENGVPDEGGGLALAAFRAALDLGRLGLAKGDAVLLGPILAWSVDTSGSLAYPAARGALGDSLLLPWLDAEPAAGVKATIQSFLLTHFGDPRFSARNWVHVSPDGANLFRKWMARAALDHYLKIIDGLALERHWMYRKAFWNVFFRRDIVADARVLFARQCASRASTAFGAEASFAPLSTGRYGGKIVEDNHAVLLLRIVDLTIADWSHDGQWMIWRSSNISAPKLDMKSYWARDIAAESADFHGSHTWSETYSWQKKLRNIIYELTNIWIGDDEFRV